MSTQSKRISRATFWKTIIPLPIIGFFVLQLDFRLQTGAWRIAPSGPALLFYWTLISVCILLAVFVMRSHDRNKSGLWALLYIVPYIGWIWALVELGFFKGTDGPNRFGPDPLHRAPASGPASPTISQPTTAPAPSVAPPDPRPPTSADVPSALAQALSGNLSARTRQATEFALRYVRAVAYLDDCGDFTLEKLRTSYDIAGLTAAGTREETQAQWDKSKLIVSTPGSPGGPEFIRHDMRRLLLEGVTNAAPHIGLLEGPLREWLEQRHARPATAPLATAVEALSRGTPDAIALADANQFLRYRAGSRTKVDAQVALMDALLTRPDAPPVKVALLRSVVPSDEFPWLIVKSGTRGAIAEMRAYAGFDETFKSLFGDQPFSIVWADHIAENCPGPGEAVTPLGREKYAQISQAISAGNYLVERHCGAAGS